MNEVEVIFLVEADPEGGYAARALGYSIFTEADTWDELKAAVQDAVHCHFEEDERPAMVRLQDESESVRICVDPCPIKLIAAEGRATERSAL